MTVSALPRIVLVLSLLLAAAALQATPEIPLPIGFSRITTGTPATPPTVATKGIAPSDWQGIRAAHGNWQRRFDRQDDGTWAARHPGQRWRSTFDGRGFLVEPGHGEWTWGLELRRYGAAGKDAPAASTVDLETPEEVIAGENHLLRRWGHGLTEWYHNGSEGLQQGWTVAAPPTGAEAADGLRLEFVLRGGLIPQVENGARGIVFADAGGCAALTYRGLKAWDADGRDVPVRFESVAGQEVGAVAVVADIARARFPVTIDPVAQQAYLKASNVEEFDNFGSSVSVSGDTVVVGAWGEGSNDINAPGNNSADNAGAAYVFVRTGTGWSQQAYLKASNAEANDRFGSSVSVSGNTVVVGAYWEDSNDINDPDNNDATNAGAAYVFVRTGTNWIEQAYLKASNAGANDRFGTSVAVSGDIVVVGADGEDSDGSNAGAAYVFVRDGEDWNEEAFLTATNTEGGDGFGYSVSVSGNTVVVGARYEDSNDIGAPDNNGATWAGAAYVFVHNGTDWIEQAYLKASNAGANDEFGSSVSVSGDTVVVGAYLEDSNGINDPGDNSAGNSGAAYVFVRDGEDWTEQAYLKASNADAGDNFGSSVAVFGDTVVVGAHGEDSDGSHPDNTSAYDAGAAYVFVRDGEDWIEQAYLKASNAGENARFGASVSVSGETVVVGAYGETGNGQGGTSATNAGAAYVFGPAVPSPPVVFRDTAKPALKILKKKTLKTARNRHTIHGLATDNVAVSRVEVQSRLQKGWKKAKLKPNGKFKFKTKRLRKGKNPHKFRAVDSSGNRSRVVKAVPTGR